MKRSKTLLASLIISILYCLMLALMIFDTLGSSDDPYYQIGVAIGLKMIQGHLILVGIGTVLSLIAYILKNKWLTLAAAICFTTSMVTGFIMTYGIYVIPEVVLLYTSFGLQCSNKQVKSQDNIPSPKSEKKECNDKKTHGFKLSTLNIILMITAAVIITGAGTFVYASMNPLKYIPIASDLSDMISKKDLDLNTVENDLKNIKTITRVLEKNDDVKTFEIYDSNCDDGYAAAIKVYDSKREAKKAYDSLKDGDNSLYLRYNLVLTVKKGISNDHRDDFLYSFQHMVD